MATIGKAVIKWEGWEGAPGYSSWYATDMSSCIPYIRNFYQAIQNYVPAEVSWSFPESGFTYDTITGTPGVPWVHAAQPAVTGMDPGDYAVASGACVSWHTNTIRPAWPPKIGGRLLRGRTFLVPLAASAYNASGNIDVTVADAIIAGADALLAAVSPQLVVWGQPSEPDDDHPATRPGLHGVVAYATLDRVGAIRRSRR